MSAFQYFTLLSAIYLAPVLPKWAQLCIATGYAALQWAAYLKGAA